MSLSQSVIFIDYLWFRLSPERINWVIMPCVEAQVSVGSHIQGVQLAEAAIAQFDPWLGSEASE
jgi:hypothetical protein